LHDGVDVLGFQMVVSGKSSRWLAFVEQILLGLAVYEKGILFLLLKIDGERRLFIVACLSWLDND